MVCYIVPAIVAIAGLLAKKSGKFNDTYGNWFVMLFLGGSLFGVVDHLWNGELFLISENLVSDILLGIAITFTIAAVWAIAVHLDKLETSMPVKTKA